MPGGSQGRRPQPLVRSAGCRRLTAWPLCLPPPTLPTAGPGLSEPEPMAGPPCPWERIACPTGPGTSPRASGSGHAPGRPIALPAPASFSRVEARSSTSKTYHSSSTQVANLAGFGSGKPERSACVSRRAGSAGPRVLGHPCRSPPLVPTGTAGFMHLQLGYEGPNAVLSSGCFWVFVLICQLGLLLCCWLLLFLTNCPVRWGWVRGPQIGLCSDL